MPPTTLNSEEPFYCPDIPVVLSFRCRLKPSAAK